MQQVGFGQLLGIQGRISATEINRAVADLVDASARTNGLVIQLNANGIANRFRPFLIDWVREGRPRACDLRALGLGTKGGKGEGGAGAKKKGSPVHRNAPIALPNRSGWAALRF